MAKHLKFGTEAHEPWLIIKNGIQCEGILCELIIYLSNSLNFSYSFENLRSFGFNTSFENYSKELIADFRNDVSFFYK